MSSGASPQPRPGLDGPIGRGVELPWLASQRVRGDAPCLYTEVPTLKRALLLLFVALTLLVPLAATAQELSGVGASGARLFPMQVKFRNTTAASTVALSSAWNVDAGRTDSLVFRKAAAAPTSYDTSMSYNISRFPLPPTMGPAYIPSIADTLFPWIVVKFAQDTTSYAFANNSIMDSVRVGIEFSDNNVDWFSATGTPTYRFDTVFFTSGSDGLQSPSLIGVELLGAIDGAMIPIKARVNQTNGASAVILNSVAIGQYKYMRFLFGGDYTGQFKADLLYWSTSSNELTN